MTYVHFTIANDTNNIIAVFKVALNVVADLNIVLTKIFKCKILCKYIYI